MKCPHCLNSYHPQENEYPLGADKDFFWRVHWQECPSCHRYIIMLRKYDLGSTDYRRGGFFAYPKAPSRTPISGDVPNKFAQDYKEACLVIADSPKASAALSRRCLQNIIREKVGVQRANLSQEIDEVIKSEHLPSHLAEGVDAIRSIGNFAAHPIKSTNTGEIVDVELGEAEWLLDLLEGLFDFCFVQPAKLKKKREELNKKLTDAGKPPMK